MRLSVVSSGGLHYIELYAEKDGVETARLAFPGEGLELSSQTVHLELFVDVRDHSARGRYQV